MTVDLIIGTLTSISANFINPYTGEILSVNGDYYLNDTLVTGGPGTDDIALGVTFDQFWRLEDELGNLLIENIEVFLPAPGDDILLLSSATYVLGDLTIQTAEGNDVVWSNAGNDLIGGGLGNDILHGGPGHDTINGDDDQDELFGASGNDILTGGTGNDQLSGGTGDDTYIYNTGDGDDTITETSGFDTISLGSGITLGDITFVQNGNDLDIMIASGITVKDFYSGDADKIVEQIVFSDASTFDLTSLLTADTDDTFIATSDIEHFDGEGGIDTVDYSGSATRVKLNLGAGIGWAGDADDDTYVSIENVIGTDIAGDRDFIYGSSADNYIWGLAGNDQLEGLEGADIIDGGAGSDYANYTRSGAGVTVNLKTGVNTGGDAEGDILISIEKITGSEHDDVLTGNDGNNTLAGLRGDDILSGGLGNDILDGYYGHDTFIYTAGHDTIIERGNGIETVIFDASWSPEDVVISGNTLTLQNSTTNYISFNDISLIEWFVFDGYEAMDLAMLQSFGSPFQHVGGISDDAFVAMSAIEYFDGGDGIDTVDYSNASSRVNVDLENGFGWDGYAAGDTYVSIENVIGTDIAGDRDFIYGSDADNYIWGLAGNDQLEGNAGADTIDGGSGSDYANYTRSDEGVTVNMATGINTGGDAEGDTLISIENINGSDHNDSITGNHGANKLYAGKGDDLIYGGAGNDILYGEEGADIFLYGASDTFGFIDIIRDFSTSQGDKIDISDLLVGYDPLTDAINDFVSFTSAGSTGAHGAMSIDVDGGGDNFVLIGYITSQPDLDAETLETSGNLITV